jgi:hypothetical protein
MSKFISTQVDLDKYVTEIKTLFSEDEKLYENIKTILTHITKISNSGLATIQIKQLLINQLKELIPIIVNINTFNLFETNVNVDTYKAFDILAWKFYYCITEYNTILGRLSSDTQTEKIKIENELKLVGGTLVNLKDMPFIIPNDKYASLIKETTGTYRNIPIYPITMDFNTSKKSLTSNKHIIILPGCADNMQGIDRVNLCAKLIKGFYETNKTNDNVITHIIVSGRGSGSGTGFYKQIDSQINNTDKLPHRFVKLVKQQNLPLPRSKDYIGKFDRNTQIDLVKYGEFNPPYKGFTHFKTEAYYMAIEINRLLNELYKDISITKLKPKILLEPLAAETAANFVFSPFSCLYEYDGGDDGNGDDVKIHKNATSNEAIDTLTNEFLTTLLESNLHIISHDYHILRCINTSMQTLRPTLHPTITDTYGNIYYYCVKDITESPKMLAYNAFESFAQPYSQLFFDMLGTKTAKINYEFNNSIPIQRITEKQELKYNPYNFLFELVVRLLTFHGMYSPNVAGPRLTNLMYKIYPNILVGNLDTKITVGGYLNVKKRTNKNKNAKNKKSKKNKHSNKK